MIVKTTDLEKFYETIKTIFITIKEMPLGSNFGYLLEPLLDCLNKYLENSSYELNDKPLWDALNKLKEEIKELHDSVINWF